MWEPNLSNTPKRKGKRSLLFKAQRIFGGVIVDRLEDEVGIFALNLIDYILVAKGYIHGYIVSAHKRAVISALNQKKEILMYIERGDKFYRFDPKKILNTGEENMKGKALMINFDIKLGERLL